MTDVNLNTKGLEKIIKALKQNRAEIHVGVLKGGARAQKGKSKSTIDNAELGAIHEFGTSTIPARSFLRIPLAENLDKRLKSSGALDKETLKEVIQQGNVTPFLKKIAIVAEEIVSDAFATAGFGKWPAWKKSGYTNNAGMLLVDTGQLRNSITSEVKE